jgi:hypothetical protein
MTTSVALANMPSTPTDVAVKFLDQSLLKLRSSIVTPDGSTYSAEYVLASGDPTQETTVVVRVQTDVKNNVIRNTIRLRTVQIVTVDSVVTETAPVEVVLGWNVPGSIENTAVIMAMIGTAYSLSFNGVTTKVPNTGILDALNRSLLGSLYS